LVLLFAYLGSTANYSISYVFGVGDTTCSGGYIAFSANLVSSSGSCFATNCTNIGSQYGKTVCDTSLPADPAGAIVSGQYANQDCSGDPTFYAAASSGTCNPKTDGTSTKVECAGNYKQTDYTSPDCTTGGSVSVDVPFSGSFCTAGTYLSCALKCFHTESTITIGDKPYSYEDLKKEDSPCAIPHEFKANGLKIATTCPGVLRVTSEHLVMTSNGWKMAGELREGDKLFSKVHSENADCTITDISSDVGGQYFGLNCESSHVGSDGYWVSTFGYTHNIPAAWMNVVSKLFGVKFASNLGDKISHLLQRWSIV